MVALIVIGLVCTLVIAIAYKILVVGDHKGDKLISGMRERLENKKYAIADLMDSSPEMFFDNTQLLLLPNEKRLSLAGLSARNDSFFNNLGITQLDALQTTAGSVAILMPFNSRYNNRYETIKQVCNLFGFHCHRSDDSPKTGNLLKQIVEMILNAQLIIAVLDGKNPNVFYEIGLAHALGKPTILIANMDDERSVPFNVSSERMLFYSNMDDLSSKLTKTLSAIVNAR